MGRARASSWAENSWDPTASYKMTSIDPITRNDDYGIVEMRQMDEFISDHPRASLLGTEKLTSIRETELPVGSTYDSIGTAGKILLF